MILQYLGVTVLVSLAASYVLRQTWRTWTTRPGQNCGGGCGCSGKSKPATNGAAVQPLISTEELTARLRQRP